MVRLASIDHQGRHKLAAEIVLEGKDGNFYVDLSSIAPHTRAFLEAGEASISRANTLIANAKNDNDTSDCIAASNCRLLAPIEASTVGKFLCIGMNYEDHCAEQNLPLPEQPVVFSKFSTCISGPNDPVVSACTDALDYEVELGVVIGATVPRNTDAAHAERYIGGYTVVHDVSARDWQMKRNGGQWLLGKAQDGFAPIGPVIVTKDELPIEKIHALKIMCRVNGETLQDSTTAQLVHKVDVLIAYLSKFMTLFPGDIIATGTPPGVGCFRDPPRWLLPGDVVECEIDSIGILRSPIVGAIEEGTPPAASFATFSRSGMHLYGRSCIVTGGAQGIGFGIAQKLGQEGAAHVTIVDVNADAVAAATKSLQAHGTSCYYHGMVCDVTKMVDVETTWARVAEVSGGRLEVLVQAAGVVGSTGIKCQDVDPGNFDQVMDVNVKGIFNGCKCALPYMTKQDYGRIINIASIAGKEGNAGMLAYSTSKAAVIGLTKTIGKEYAETGITCNALAPAVVRTQMVADMPPAQVKYMTDKIPMKRCGTIEEIASMVAFMASPDSSFTTGFCFDASGGRAVY